VPENGRRFQVYARRGDRGQGCGGADQVESGGGNERGEGILSRVKRCAREPGGGLAIEICRKEKACGSGTLVGAEKSVQRTSQKN